MAVSGALVFHKHILFPWGWENLGVNPQVFSTQSLKKRSLMKTLLWEKKKMLVTNIFLLLQKCFLPIPKTTSVVKSIILSSANAFNFDQSKNLSFGKELT